MLITEYLKIEYVNGEDWILCRKCDFKICRAKDKYKEGCLSKDSKLGDSNPLIDDSLVSKFIDHVMVFRQYFCPNCGINIENEITKKDDPPFHDMEIERGG